MTDLHPTIKMDKEFLIRPFVVLAMCLLVVLAVINSLAPYNSMTTVKGFIVLVFTSILFLLTLQTFRFLVYFYVGGAVLQGFSFLVPPTALEQKHFFSYFFLQMGSVKFYLFDCFLLTAACAILLQFLVQRHQASHLVTKEKALQVWVTLFIAYGTVMTLLSVHSNGKSAIGESRTILFAGLFFVAANLFITRSEIIGFLRFFVIVSLLRTFLNFITVVLSPAYLSYRRPFGSNSDAAYCAVSFLLLLVLQDRLIERTPVRRFAQVWLILFPILITSRSTILCLVIVIFISVLVSRSISVKQYLLWITVVTLVAIASISVIMSVPALQELLLNRFANLLQNYQADPTSNWRILGWVFAIESIVDHPFFGVGLGRYAERFINGEWVKVSLHSAYLDYLYCLGLVGVSLFVATIAYGLTATMKKYRNSVEGVDHRIALAVFLVIFFLALFIAINAEMSYALVGTVMWIFLGMVPLVLSDNSTAPHIQGASEETA